MSRLFKVASSAAVLATMGVAVAMTVPGMAQTGSADVANNTRVVPQTVVPSTPAANPPVTTIALAPIGAPTTVETAVPAEVVEAAQLPRVRANSLSETVRQNRMTEASDRQHHCMAVGVYYESRAESLEGQLAVAHVIMNRVRSGRFADSVCGVLTQRSQFSFVRGGVLPTPPNNPQWQTALSVAKIAMNEEWDSQVPGALFFHASRVSPGWNRARIGRIGNHIFYR